MVNYEHVGIYRPIIHGEWQAARAALERVVEHEKVAPFRIDLSSSLAGAREVKKLLGGEMRELVDHDPTLLAGYTGAMYFTNLGQWASGGAQGAKPEGYKSINGF